ncbi:hypothetical protein Tco_0641319 [Tanacetum coccineum]
MKEPDPLVEASEIVPEGSSKQGMNSRSSIIVIVTLCCIGISEVTSERLWYNVRIVSSGISFRKLTDQSREPIQNSRRWYARGLCCKTLEALSGQKCRVQPESCLLAEVVIEQLIGPEKSCQETLRNIIQDKGEAQGFRLGKGVVNVLTKRGKFNP